MKENVIAWSVSLAHVGKIGGSVPLCSLVFQMLFKIYELQVQHDQLICNRDAEHRRHTGRANVDNDSTTCADGSVGIWCSAII